jgi:hypothetical protein
LPLARMPHDTIIVPISLFVPPAFIHHAHQKNQQKKRKASTVCTI